MDNKEGKVLVTPMVPLRGLVVFPNETAHFEVGRPKSIAAVKAAMAANKEVFLVAQRDITEDAINTQTLYKIGTVCRIKQITRLPNENTLRVVVEGVKRASLLAITGVSPFFTSSIMELEDDITRKIKDPSAIILEFEDERDLTEVLATIRMAKALADEYFSHNPNIAHNISLGVCVINREGELADYIASNIPLEYSIKQTVLEEIDALKRLKNLCVILKKEINILTVEEELNRRVQEQIDENQREFYLREQLKAISNELNNGDSSEVEAEKYRESILKIGFNSEDEEKLLLECDRLMKMQSSSAESAVIRNYLDEVISLPWNTYTKENFNIKKAEEILEKEHYGLKEVKQRITELLAVRKLAPDIKGQIICLSGPPGVGKTSIAKSLAKAMGRKYARISLGGVKDEAEIRGHRKTYIGAMPGNIIDALKRSKSANPLILLDEVDKLSSDYKGDPSSALLEALDPEQNNSFRDHYIDIPFDLSKVLFVTTANDIGNIPAPLRDRMEIIELYSYTFDEKFNIAKKHLIPKQLKEYGLKASQLKIRDDALKFIIEGYTKEAGVRTLERTIAKVLRKEAVKFASGFEGKIMVKQADIEELLGPRRYKSEALEKEDKTGVVNGLAWTSAGGEMLQIEALSTEGTGKLELTGSLGDVMKESAKAAYSYIRSIASEYSIDTDFYKTKDVHLHFPEGAVPKDGPSAGIGITTALVSALSGVSVKCDIAMTGEVTLTGRVLAIGGLKEKSMAAYKSGIKTVIIPEENAADIKQFDKSVVDALNFIPVTHVSEVLKLALNVEENPEKKINISVDDINKTRSEIWQRN